MKKVLKYIGRALLVVGITAVWLILVFGMSAGMICYGPSESAKRLFVTNMMESERTQWVPGVFLSSEELEALTAASSGMSADGQ